MHNPDVGFPHRGMFAEIRVPGARGLFVSCTNTEPHQETGIVLSPTSFRNTDRCQSLARRTVVVKLDWE